MQLEVYRTDAEAFEAAAALAAERLVTAAARGRASVALPGRRAALVALAAHEEVPWNRVAVFWTDECCVLGDDPRSNVRVAHESLLGPRSVAPDRIHPPPVDGRAPAEAAAAYAAVLTAELGTLATFDVVLLDLSADGHIAALMPGSAALHSEVTVAVVPAEEVTGDPRVARVTVTPAVLRAARHTIVTAVGAACAPALSSALREPVDIGSRPAQLVPPSPSVTWIVDRAAAEELLRDARPVAEPRG